MSMANAFDVALVALLLAMAVWVVVARAAFSAIVVFVAYGLLVAIAWVRRWWMVGCITLSSGAGQIPTTSTATAR